RRALPSIFTAKSAGASVVICLPLASKPVTSSEVTSTDDWKLGFGGGGCCACADRKKPGRTQRTQSKNQNGVSLRSRRSPRFFRVVTAFPPPRDIPAAPALRGGRRLPP